MSNINYPYNLTKEEVIQRITEVYHAGYDLNNTDFDIYDQLLACEAVAEAEEEERKIREYYFKQENSLINNENNDNTNGDDNGTCKHTVNFELTLSKQEAIDKLKSCNYKTPPKYIAQLLETIFIDNPSVPGYWLSVAQKWNPRAINRVINTMIKSHDLGHITIKNPSKYFSFLIQKRKQRRGR